MNTRIEWAVNRINHWVKFYESKFPRIGSLGLTYEFSSRLRTTAGYAYSRRRHITLNYYMLKSECDKFDATIAHEIAHVVADAVYGGINKHNSNWRYVFGLSGYPVNRCHNYESSVRNKRTRLKFNCVGCGKTLFITKNIRTKIRNGHGRVCKTCKCIIDVYATKFEEVYV